MVSGYPDGARAGKAKLLQGARDGQGTVGGSWSWEMRDLDGDGAAIVGMKVVAIVGMKMKFW